MSSREAFAVLLHLIGAEQLWSRRHLIAGSARRSAAPGGWDEPECLPQERTAIRFQFRRCSGLLRWMDAARVILQHWAPATVSGEPWRSV